VPFGDVTKDVTITMKMLNRLKPGVRDGKGDLKDLERQAERSSKEIDSDFKKASRGISGSFGSMKTAGVAAFAAIGAATAAATGIAWKAVEAANEQERAEVQLAAVLESTGHAAGVTADDMKLLAAELQKVTTYGDETIIAAENILLTFKQIGKEVLPDTIEVVLDMATALGTDLKSQAIQVGKALNDPVEGLSALQRAGVTFTESQKEVIQSLVDTGNVADAQRLILKELETEFGGSARALTLTAQGEISQIQNMIGDGMEVAGKIMLARFSPYITDIRDEMNKLADVGWDKVIDDWDVMTVDLRTKITAAAVELGSDFAWEFTKAVGLGISGAALGFAEKSLLAVWEAGALIVTGNWLPALIETIADVLSEGTREVTVGFEPQLVFPEPGEAETPQTLNEKFGLPAYLTMPVRAEAPDPSERTFPRPAPSPVQKDIEPPRPTIDFGMEEEGFVGGMTDAYATGIAAHAGYLEQLHVMNTDDFALRHEELTTWFDTEREMLDNANLSKEERLAAETALFELQHKKRSEILAEEVALRNKMEAAAFDTIGALGKGYMSEFQGQSKELFAFGKGLAAAEALYNTHAMAVAAAKSMAVFGPVAAFAAGAAATIYGLARVASIASTKYEKKMITGGWVDGPPGIDVISTKLTRDEYVMPPVQSSMYAHELEAMKAGVFPSAPAGAGIGGGRTVVMNIHHHGVTLATDDAAMLDWARSLKFYLDEVETEYSEA